MNIEINNNLNNEICGTVIMKMSRKKTVNAINYTYLYTRFQNILVNGDAATNNLKNIAKDQFSSAFDVLCE